MYSYEDLVLDDTVHFNKRLLTRNSSRAPGVFLEEGILTKLVTFARTRKHNQRPDRPSSICSVCCRISNSSQKCRRWNASHLAGLPQSSTELRNSESATLQPYCEVLGSFLCSDCSLEQTKQNHLLHLPVIFGLESKFKHKNNDTTGNSNKRAVDKWKGGSGKGILKSTLREGAVARASTPHRWNDDRQFNSRTPRPLREQMERLASLPDLLGKRKYRLRKWMHQEKKKWQKSDDLNFDLKSLVESSLDNSMGSSLFDVNQRKAKVLANLKVPCSTPKEGLEMIGNTNTEHFDVVMLAQKLQDLYRERYFPLRMRGSLPEYCSPFYDSSLVSGTESFPLDESTLERLFLQPGESPLKQNDNFTYRTLTLSPTTTDVQDTRRIQENLIGCYGQMDKRDSEHKEN